MTGSRIVAVRSALMDALEVAIHQTEGMADVVVGFQHPTGSDIPRECVWSANGRPTFASAGLSAGRNKLNETTTFDLLFRAGGPDVSMEEMAQRVLDIATVAVEWIGDHKNNELGVTGLQQITVAGEGDAQEFAMDSGHGAGIRIPIKYVARLT